MSKAQAKKQRRTEKKGKRVQSPPLHKGMLWASLAVAAIGAALSLYGTNLTFSIAQQGVVDPSGCSINDWINCDVAHASSYAVFMGIPVAWWGFLFYAWAFISVLFAAQTSNRDAAAASVSVAWVLSLGAVLFSLFKAYHLVSLNVLCVLCLAMYVASIALAILLPLSMGLSLGKLGTFLGDYIKGVTGKPSGLSFSPQPLRFGVLLLVFFGLGFVGIKNYEMDNITQPDIDLDQNLTVHFRQTPKSVMTEVDAPSWGNPDARIKIVEFADYQCPACREAAFHLKGALFEFRDDVHLSFVNYPLDDTINDNLGRQVHAFAGPAAIAGMCAMEQGDFWDYHDGLFRNQNTLGERLFVQLAEDNEYDMDAFKTCRNAPETRERVRRDIEHGVAAQITSTPTVFINGRRVAYWRNADFIRAVIREEMDRL